MNKKIKDYIYISLFAVLITVCSWISIPYAIPFSMQTFAVFSAINIMGAKKASYALLIYILLGITGLPVFAGFRGGISALLSPTGGFIFGFFLIPLFSYISGLLIKNKATSIISGEIAGLLFCYIMGVLWYVLFTSSLSIDTYLISFAMLALPYFVPDIIKLMLSYIFCKRLSKRI